jgi:hypothetical protein
MSVDGVRDDLVRPTRFVLVDQNGPFTVVAHAGHQVLDARVPRRGEGVPGMAEIMKVQALDAYRPDHGRAG